MKLPKLNKKELAEVTHCYAKELPDWQYLPADRIVRSEGPILQEIGFEALSTGDYRPSASISARAIPTVWMLTQLLDIKHRQIRRLQHPRMWRSVLVAMEQQFKPSIRNPIDLQEVKQLCQKNSKNSTNDMCMLAILNGYLGQKDEAILLCESMQKSSSPTLALAPKFRQGKSLQRIWPTIKGRHFDWKCAKLFGTKR